MECCRSLQLSAHIFLKCTPKCTEKSSIPVKDEYPWDLKVHLDLFEGHVFYLLLFQGHLQGIIINTLLNQ